MTFKANWEKTHTRVHLPDELIMKMLRTYYTSENYIKSISVISGGCANINVLVHLNNSDDPVILRIYLRNRESGYKEQKISELLNGKLPVPKFYHITEDFGYIFAIIEYLPGKTLRDFLLSDKQIDISTYAGERISVDKLIKVISCLKLGRRWVLFLILHSQVLGSLIKILKSRKILPGRV